jgi:hypothetical protein
VRPRAVLVVSLLVARAVLAGAVSDPPATLRPTTTAARRLIDDAIRVSPTIAGLVVALQGHQVIAFVELEVLSPGRREYTTLMNATASGRMLRIVVNQTLVRRDRIAMLGHELQHVLEVAREPEVVDDRTFLAFLRRAGYEIGPARFETDAARRVEEAVRCELMRPRTF